MALGRAWLPCRWLVGFVPGTGLNEPKTAEADQPVIKSPKRGAGGPSRLRLATVSWPFPGTLTNFLSIYSRILAAHLQLIIPVAVLVLRRIYPIFQILTLGHPTDLPHRSGKSL